MFSSASDSRRQGRRQRHGGRWWTCRARAPFVNLPIGATEDRLLGGLDVEKALKGEPALKRGLLADANGGVLYLDEVNLLPDHLADALLDAVASGVHHLEREGFSVAQAAEFVLIGSMNPEEGALRPQLLDRFALAVDVTAPMEPAIRREVMARRLAFDHDAPAFADRWRMSRCRWRGSLRTRAIGLGESRCPQPMLDVIADTIVAHGCGRCVLISPWFVPAAPSRRWKCVASVDASHVEAVAPALAHRALGRLHERRPEPAAAQPPSEDSRASGPRHPIGSLRRLTWWRPRLVVEQPLAPTGASVRPALPARCDDRGPADRGSARARSSRDGCACGEPWSNHSARCRRLA
jgi:magnesium chelatase subunit D